MESVVDDIFRQMSKYLDLAISMSAQDRNTFQKRSKAENRGECRSENRDTFSPNSVSLRLALFMMLVEVA